MDPHNDFDKHDRKPKTLTDVYDNAEKVTPAVHDQMMDRAKAAAVVNLQRSLDAGDITREDYDFCIRQMQKM